MYSSGSIKSTEGKKMKLGRKLVTLVVVFLMVFGAIPTTGAIAAGRFHTLVLYYDGALRSAGEGQNGRLGDGSTDDHSTMSRCPVWAADKALWQ
jgi:hypothetical protein